MTALKGIPGNKIVLFSSFIYIVTAIALNGTNKIIISFLFLVFLTCIFYHSYPKNIYFRIADWIASASFAAYLIWFIYENNLIASNSANHIFVLSIIALLNWILSLFYSKESDELIYTWSHVFWHLFSSITIYLIAISSYISIL